MLQSSLSSIDLDSPAAMDRKEREEPESVPCRPGDVSVRKGVPAVPVRPPSLSLLHPAEGATPHSSMFFSSVQTADDVFMFLVT